MMACFKSMREKKGEEMVLESSSPGQVPESLLTEKSLDMGGSNVEMPFLDEQQSDYPYALEYKGPPLNYAVPKVEPLNTNRHAGPTVKSSYPKISHMAISGKDPVSHVVSQRKLHLTKMRQAESPTSAGKLSPRDLHLSQGPSKRKQKTAFKVTTSSQGTLLSKEELLSYTSLSWIADDFSLNELSVASPKMPVSGG
ncbi:hypothetical protein O6H91_17G015800 [Diphasiastrum complanatum]|uniref:Uncharacterized protein n=1 Tax=Diphasiastrum complanatum TaxID=34168 RepID=A0ACC2B4F9_DIPCM|nr:hypothetical protein O6H91_17G015800 [Diphasiastrum complanatum]